MKKLRAARSFMFFLLTKRNGNITLLLADNSAMFTEYDREKAKKK